MSMVINGTSGITFPDGSLQGIGVGRRNLIINGAMQVAQRGTQVTGVTNNTYRTCDRFQVGAVGLGTWTIDQSTDAPDGFAYSLKQTCTTADASPAANDFVRIRQQIEGQNCQHLAYGTSAAKDVTVSFWVKSNVTGTFSAILRNANASANRIAGSRIAVSSADTWEYKTFTVSGDTSYGVDNNNTGEFLLELWLNSGSTYTGGTSTSTWKTLASTDYFADATFDLGHDVGDYFAITGVQLEVGSVATPFEHRSYGEELALCQRYYVRYSSDGSNNQAFLIGVVNSSTSAAICSTNFANPMRAIPTASYSGADTLRIFDGSGAPVLTSISTQASSITTGSLDLVASGGGLTTGRAALIIPKSSTACYVDFDAEL
jgi:hypothetical protein